MTLHRGYIKLWRKAMDSSVWLDEGLWKMWCWCLMKAAWEAKSIPFKAGRTVISVDIQPGQFVFSRNAAAEELQLPPSTVRNRLENLKKLGNVDIKADSNYSIISVCNWERYASFDDDQGQLNGQGEDKERTRRGQGEDTKKKDKNVKNRKNVKKRPLSSKLDGGGRNKNDDVLDVFSHYRTYHPMAAKNPLPSSKEWRAIESRLKEGHSVADLRKAIDGCHKTPHNLGENENNSKYLGLELIMRNGSQVLRFIENDDNPPVADAAQMPERNYFNG